MTRIAAICSFGKHIANNYLLTFTYHCLMKAPKFLGHCKMSLVQSPRCVLSKSVLTNFAKLTGKHVNPETLLKRRLWHRCFRGSEFSSYKIELLKTFCRNSSFELLTRLWNIHFELLTQKLNFIFPLSSY